jgi:RND family efflux transporter MFP subunit
MIRYAIPVIVCLTSGCSGTASDESPAPVALVTLGRAEKAAIAETVTLYGVVEIAPAGEHVLAAPVEAVVMSIDAPAGTRVQRGQVIAHLGQSPATRAELAKAIAEARAADTAYARQQRLRADGLVGNSEVETARAAALSADALRDSLMERSKALLLTAPSSGYVATFTPHPGDVVATGSPVATIARVNQVRAHFGIDPGLARRVGVGASLMIAPAAGGAPIASQILSVSPVADAQTKLAAVFASIPPDAGLNAGIALTGSLALTATTEALSVPYAALLDDGGQPFVFVVADNVAHRHDVVTGVVGSERIAITKGLSAGDQVVTQGGTAVDDGMKVRLK